VRELAHFAERLAMGLDMGADMHSAAQDDAGLPLADQLARFEAHLLNQAFLSEGGDANRTAARLAIPRETFTTRPNAMASIWPPCATGSKAR
jgi:two-component system C4-dicarboxylate transport response regulator DctD